MRRLALSVLTACGLALLSACSGGTGLGNSGSSITSVVFMNGSSQVNDFFVAPGGIAPLYVSAVGTNGSSGADIVYGQSFVWSARLVNPKTDPPSISEYTTGIAPSTFKTCATPASFPAVSLLQKSTVSGSAYGYVGYGLLPAGQAAESVYVGAVPGVSAPYCIVLTAIHPSDKVSGTVTVVVSASP